MYQESVLLGLPLKTWTTVGGLFLFSALAPSIAVLILKHKKVI